MDEVGNVYTWHLLRSAFRHIVLLKVEHSLQALCSERYKDWSGKFDPLGAECTVFITSNTLPSP
jgi:hypothetical protein